MPITNVSLTNNTLSVQNNNQTPSVNRVADRIVRVSNLPNLGMENVPGPSHHQVSVITDKTTPYYATKNNRNIKLNDVVMMEENKDKKIVCRHLAYAWAERFMSTDGRLDYREFKSPEAIRQMFPSYAAAESQFWSWQASSNCALMGNADWGRLLESVICSMAKSHVSKRSFLIATPVHVIAVGVKFKEKQTGTSCIINFYDPNQTATHQRLEVRMENLRDIRKLQAADFLRADDMELYGLLPDGIAAFMNRQEGQTTPKLAHLLTTQFNSTVFFQCMSLGLVNGVQLLSGEFTQSFQALSQEQKMELLTARSPDGRTGLLAALQYEHVEAVRAFGELLQTSGLTSEQKVKLLAATQIDGASGLSFALELGLTKSVRVYGEIIQAFGLTDEQKTELLSARRRDGLSGLCPALERGHAETVRVYGEIIRASKLTTEQKVKLLSARRSDGLSGLCPALEQGHAEVIHEYGEIILASGLTAEQKAELLSARRSDGASGLCLALERGHAETVRVYGEIILASELTAEQKVKLLSARRSDGISGLYVAFQYRHAETIRVYGEIILASGLTAEQKVKLLSARRSDGLSGLCPALERGYAEEIHEYGEIIRASGLTAEQKAELLSARSSDGESALYLALQNGHAETVRVYGEIIRASELTAEQKVKLLSARRSDDVSGLCPALEQGYAEVIHEYGEIIRASGLTAEQKAELLSAKRSDGASSLCLALELGRAETVRVYGEIILASELTAEQKAELLSARRSDDTPSLCLALEQGYAEVVRVYGEIISDSGLTAEQKAELLSTRRSDGASSLYIALQYRHAETVRVYGEIIRASELTSEQKVKLLSARRSDGVSGLCPALELGYAETVRVYGEIISDSGLTAEQKAELLSTRRSDGASSLYIALQYRHAETVRVYGEIIRASELTSEQKVKLLSARRSDGASGLCPAFERGYAEVIHEYGEIIRASGLTAEQKAELLSTRRSDGVSSLYIALQSGHAEAVRVYGEIISDSGLTSEQKVKLLSARRSDGIPGLYLGLHNGHAETVRVYGEMIRAPGLTAEQKAELLSARRSDGIPGLYVALLYGHAETVRVYGEIIRASELTAEQKVKLLSARRSDGVSGLCPALERGHAEVIHEYGEIIRASGLTAEQKAELLSARRSDGTPSLYIALQSGHAEAVRVYGEIISDSGLTSEQKTDLLNFRCSDDISNTEAIRAYGEIQKKLLQHTKRTADSEMHDIAQSPSHGVKKQKLRNEPAGVKNTVQASTSPHSKNATATNAEPLLQHKKNASTSTSTPTSTSTSTSASTFEKRTRVRGSFYGVRQHAYEDLHRLTEHFDSACEPESQKTPACRNENIVGPRQQKSSRLALPDAVNRPLRTETSVPASVEDLSSLIDLDKQDSIVLSPASSSKSDNMLSDSNAVMSRPVPPEEPEAHKIIQWRAEMTRMELMDENKKGWKTNIQFGHLIRLALPILRSQYREEIIPYLVSPKFFTYAGETLNQSNTKDKTDAMLLLKTLHEIVSFGSVEEINAILTNLSASRPRYDADRDRSVMAGLFPYYFQAITPHIVMQTELFVSLLEKIIQRGGDLNYDFAPAVAQLLLVEETFVKHRFIGSLQYVSLFERIVRLSQKKYSFFKSIGGPSAFVGRKAVEKKKAFACGALEQLSEKGLLPDPNNVTSLSFAPGITLLLKQATKVLSKPCPPSAFVLEWRAEAARLIQASGETLAHENPEKNLYGRIPKKQVRFLNLIRQLAPTVHWECARPMDILTASRFIELKDKIHYVKSLDLMEYIGLIAHALSHRKTHALALAALTDKALWTRIRQVQKRDIIMPKALMLLHASLQLRMNASMQIELKAGYEYLHVTWDAPEIRRLSETYHALSLLEVRADLNQESLHQNLRRLLKDHVGAQFREAYKMVYKKEGFYLGHAELNRLVEKAQERVLEKWLPRLEDSSEQVYENRLLDFNEYIADYVEIDPALRRREQHLITALSVTGEADTVALRGRETERYPSTEVIHEDEARELTIHTLSTLRNILKMYVEAADLASTSSQPEDLLGQCATEDVNVYLQHFDYFEDSVDEILKQINSTVSGAYDYIQSDASPSTSKASPQKVSVRRTAGTRPVTIAGNNQDNVRRVHPEGLVYDYIQSDASPSTSKASQQKVRVRRTAETRPVTIAGNNLDNVRRAHQTLDFIRSTQMGQNLLDTIDTTCQQKGHKVVINADDNRFAATPDVPANSRNGVGTNVTVRCDFTGHRSYLTENHSLGPNARSEHEDAVLVVHELIHALHNVRGENRRDHNLQGTASKLREEAMTVGVGDFTNNPLTENAFREELGLPRRETHREVAFTPDMENDLHHRMQYLTVARDVGFRDGIEYLETFYGIAEAKAEQLPLYTEKQELARKERDAREKAERQEYVKQHDAARAEHWKLMRQKGLDPHECREAERKERDAREEKARQEEIKRYELIGAERRKLMRQKGLDPHECREAERKERDAREEKARQEEIKRYELIGAERRKLRLQKGLDPLECREAERKERDAREEKARQEEIKRLKVLGAERRKLRRQKQQESLECQEAERKERDAREEKARQELMKQYEVLAAERRKLRWQKQQESLECSESERQERDAREEKARQERDALEEKSRQQQIKQREVIDAEHHKLWGMKPQESLECRESARKERDVCAEKTRQEQYAREEKVRQERDAREEKARQEEKRQHEAARAEHRTLMRLKQQEPLECRGSERQERDAREEKARQEEKRQLTAARAERLALMRLKQQEPLECRGSERQERDAREEKVAKAEKKEEAAKNSFLEQVKKAELDFIAEEKEDIAKLREQLRQKRNDYYTNPQQREANFAEAEKIQENSPLAPTLKTASLVFSDPRGHFSTLPGEGRRLGNYSEDEEVAAREAARVVLQRENIKTTILSEVAKEAFSDEIKEEINIEIQAEVEKSAEEKKKEEEEKEKAEKEKEEAEKEAREKIKEQEGAKSVIDPLKKKKPELVYAYTGSSPDRHAQ